MDYRLSKYQTIVKQVGFDKLSEVSDCREETNSKESESLESELAITTIEALSETRKLKILIANDCSF